VTTTQSLEAVAREIGEQVAARYADEVDRDARFPAETVAAFRSAGLLGMLIPTGWGGPGASVQEMARAIAVTAEFCGASALVLAMHSLQVAMIVRHGADATLERVVPDLLSGELLLANANSEVGLGGDRRTSICALEPAPGGLHLHKQAATISYGEFADGILATARRGPDSPPTEQVLAVCLPPTLTLTPTGEWDTLGMRGTCSRPALITADLTPELVIDDYGDVFARTSLPTSVVLLSSVWLGIAEAAAQRAHQAVRAQARRQRSADPAAAPPPSALRLAELGVVLHQLREVVAGSARDYEDAKDLPEAATLRFSGRMDNVKLSSSCLVGDIVGRAMMICGMAGYSNGSPLSLGRISRDAAAAPLMVNNDRVLAAMAQSLLIRKDL
jgi:acyl-CoA dehydrogenase